MYIFVGRRKESKLMKHLYLIRHAHSSQAQMGMEDLKRPLSQNGQEDAQRMSKMLYEKSNGMLDLIYASPANRALSTAEIFQNAFSLEQNIDIRSDIYHRDVDDIIDFIAETDDSQDNIAVFGHNPTLSYLMNYLADANIGHLPPCGVAVIKLNASAWNLISVDNVELVEVLTPENL